MIDEKIKRLYDSFAGRFAFFRKIIDLMWNFQKELNSLRDQNMKLWASLMVAGDNIDALKEDIAELKSHVEALKEKAPEKSFRSRTDIMDSFHRAINPTE